MQWVVLFSGLHMAKQSGNDKVNGKFSYNNTYNSNSLLFLMQASGT